MLSNEYLITGDIIFTACLKQPKRIDTVAAVWSPHFTDLYGWRLNERTGRVQLNKNALPQQQKTDYSQINSNKLRSDCLLLVARLCVGRVRMHLFRPHADEYSATSVPNPAAKLYKAHNEKSSKMICAYLNIIL